MERGKFITLEGGEGVGKSTQISCLGSFLTEHGYEVVTTREPGGSPGAEMIRQLLLQGAPTRWEPLTEYLLLSAARRDHIEKVIKPSLEQGKWVICDRFFDSSLAYQGAGGGVKEDILRQIYDWIAPHFEPDITFIFNLPFETGLQRAKTRSLGLEDRFEQMPFEFHRRVQAKFREISEKNPHRCCLIDAHHTPEDTAKEIQTLMKKFLDQDKIKQDS